MRPRARILSASFPPPAAWPPSLCRGPGKRRPQGSRPPGPPDIPGIAAHNCTFSQPRNVPRGGARPGPPPSPAARLRSAPPPLRRSPPRARPAARNQISGKEPARLSRLPGISLHDPEALSGPHVDVVTVGRR
ncbi:WW domain-binding protein 11-like [Balaenoptera acutorostrata]|uniref:WW domain-binding protein 11-like n=1 Tax=Balaenoptera acutorostrata TaxID=9767 RepID=A0ABM3SG26_BALAC|nr:WW domain-binding protein 11-like [Balaenoptera acutorostrata]